MFGHDDNTSDHDESATNQPLQDDLTGAPTTDTSSVTTPDNDSPAYTTTPPDSGSTPVVPAAHDDTEAPAATVTSNDLLEIKQSALQQLSPLVGHLNQTPEEKFRTTMMMIQASDNQSLIKQAYEAAQAIEDEKTRAQALLDIINEINYFTQHG